MHADTQYTRNRNARNAQYTLGMNGATVEVHIVIFNLELLWLQSVKNKENIVQGGRLDFPEGAVKMLNYKLSKKMKV